MVLNKRGGAPKKVTLMSQFQEAIQTLCEADNAYEMFLTTYGKLISAVKTRDETIVYLIEHKCTKVYIPLILSKAIYKTRPAIEAIARLNPTLEGFDREQLNLYFEKNKPEKRALSLIKTSINTGVTYLERKKEDYTEYICTSMHYNRELVENIFEFARFSTFLDIFECWIKEYSKNGKIFDNDRVSYLSIVLEVLPEYEEQVLDKLFSTVILSPKHALDKPWENKIYDNPFNVKPINYMDMGMEYYLYHVATIIPYTESIITLIKYYISNPKMLRYIEQHFPLNADSKFVQIIKDITDIKTYISLEKHYFTAHMWRDAQSVKLFIEQYYKFEPITVAIQNDSFMNVINKETALGADVKLFIDKLYPLHRMAILNRSKKDLQNEWDLNREEYGKMINTVDHFGLTPITYAILFQNVEAIKFFTTTSPALKKKDTIGKARIDYAVTISVLKDGFTIEDLIKKYANDEIRKLFETKKDIQVRWRTNILKGYHQTNKDIANIIQNTSNNEFWFLAGSKGMFGAGIYFARTPRETQAKAHEKGVILEADMLLGNPLNLTSHGDRDGFVQEYGHLHVDMLYHTLQVNGYDSVIAIRDERTSGELRKLDIGRFMQTGNEYIVYNTEQAIFSRVVPKPRKNEQYAGTKQRPEIYLPHWLVPVQKGDLAALKKLPKNTYHVHWLMASTPLMVACARGHTEIVKWLIEEAGAGVAINTKDDMNRNAIFYAMRGGNKHIVHYLITKGVHLLEKDANGKYAIEYFNTQGLEKEIDLHKAAPKRVSVSVGYRDVLLKELVRMGDPAMDTVFRYYKNTMSPMTDAIKEKFIAYFSHKAPAARAMTSMRAVAPEPWMGVMPLRKEQTAYGGDRKRSGKK